MRVQQCVPEAVERDVRALVDAVCAAPSRQPFDPALVDLCAAVSAGLLAHPASRRFPELVALAFWLRRTELYRLGAEHESLATSSTRLAPRGVVLHLPPANVGTIAVYSWALSLLMGNKNIVRLSSRPSPVTDTIVDVVGAAIDDAPADLAQGNVFVRYGHVDRITGALSAACDLRLVWGGDATVTAVRAIPLPPRALELSFADRWSLSAIGTRAFDALDDDGRQHLAEAFFNDAFWFDQLGCASPRLVAWIGPGADACSRAFFAGVARVAAQRGWTIDAGRALDREHFAWRAALDAPVRGVQRQGDSLLVLDLEHMADLSRDHVGGGVFYQVQLDRLDDLASYIQRRDQTLGHFGLDADALRRFTAAVAGRGLDRIVPIGRALAFDRYWEGHDLLQALSRRVVLELDSVNQSVTLEELRRSAPGFAARQKKHLSQLRYAWSGPKRICFVFGCQRSGTKMVMRILDNSPATRILHENNATAFSDFQLRADPVLRTLVAAHPAPSQVFKPICDSQHADDILARFPKARGMWVYRNPDDVANSAVVKWGDHQRDIVAAAVAGDLDRWGWRTERLSDAILGDLRGAWRDDLSPHEGALLFWYMRNAFFFELGLDAHPRALLVRYEDLVTDPLVAFPALFEQVGAPFDPDFVATVRTSSVGRRDAPVASPAIRALCDGLLERLDAHAAGSSASAASSAPAPAPELPPPSPTLVLINTLGVGGAERYVVTIANWMHDRGARVAVAAREGAMAEELDGGVRFLPTDLHDLRWSLPRAARQVRGMMAELQPEIIVTNSLVVTWVARLAQLRRRVPIVAVAHGWPAERYSRVGPLMRIADRVVAVSPDVRDKLVAGGLDPARCQVVFNGVDCSPFGPRDGAHREVAREAMGAGPDDLVVINVGRLTDQKAHQHVVTIAQQLREHSPRLHFVVVGRGPRKEELQSLVSAAGLDDTVHFLGARKDVADLLGSADIYLSTSDWEGMPLSTIEAMATGLPIIATRTEGSDQLLTASCGVVCEVGDTAALADAISGLAADAPQRQEMGQAARTRALEQFGHDRMARELVAVLHEVLGS